MDPDELRRQFTFQPPRNRAEADAHRDIRRAEKRCWLLIRNQHLGDGVWREFFVHAARQDDDMVEAEAKARFEYLNNAVLDFALAINDGAPESADKTAALRCVRLARNAANEALLVHKRLGVARAEAGIGRDAAMLMDLSEEARSEVNELATWVKQQLRCARYQASSAVALAPEVAGA